ncbi:MAG: tyrosine--tRNA ligase [Candidatus Shikimatogenerans sp. JK-2022]|nr:tyrosine--tRNA ligase [Candidatus Shikimatogenerans bostrichidophilus]
MKIKILKNLKYRNLIYNYTKNIDNFFKNKKNTFYFGIDPTDDTLHIGHLLGISLINRLYKLGYKNIIILFGGATTLIKKNYNKIKINKNIKKIKKKLIKIIYNKNIKFINNIKWYKKINILNFIKKIFNIISINSLLKIKIIKSLLKKNININFSFFIYHLLQGYDYLYLYKNYKCILQIGGSDQWYNIITGIKLIYKLYKKKVYGLTYPLLLNNKGIKFSKTNKNINNIWINKNKTSIYDFYQYFINLSDNESIKYLKFFVLINKKKIKKIIKLHKLYKKKKIIQNYLLKFFIYWIYNKKVYKEIIKVMYILFKKNNYINIKKNILLIKKYIINISLLINKNENFTIYKLIKLNKIIFNSFNEYKKFIKNKGKIFINCKNLKDDKINVNNLIFNKYLIFKKGKKQFFLLKILYN